MKLRTSLIALGLSISYAGLAFGAVSAEKAAQLGKNLTLVGAEKAGNKEGTIPEFTGGLSKAPANYTKKGWRPDPFEGEKPQFSISAKNMDQYNDKLSEGIKAMLKKYPTFRLDVYPTHRTATYPKYVLDNTVKAATSAKTTGGGLSFTGAHAGLPFPIPNDGYEAMWNHLLHFNGLSFEIRYKAYTVDSSGRITMQADGDVTQEYPYYDPAKPDTKDFYALKDLFLGPARRVGEAVLIIDPIDFTKSARQGWQYLPGQRRTKLAPDLSFDTPSSLFGGQTTWDDLFLFSGSLERYNFKIIGKKEMYIPYNEYKMLYWSDPEKDLLKANHLNPDHVRWELHRVWVVEATLQPGKRHIYSKRTFYLDEDSWTALASDEYDARGQLYRSAFMYMVQNYDVLTPYSFTHGFYDFNSNVYTLDVNVAETGGVVYKSVLPDREWGPDSLAGSGVR